MKTSSFFTTVCLIGLSACAPYQIAPVEAVVEAPLPHHEVIVAFDDEPVLETAVAAEPSFGELSPNAWTVQIAALKNLETMAAVESRNSLDDVIRVPTRDSEHGELHTVLVGVYESLEAAQKVAQELPTKVAGDDPWIRRVASVQAVMR